jgi:preprotein translocase subunit SecG
MNFKTVFIIIVTVLVTVVLMNNKDEVPVWLFGETYISKLAIFGVMFGLGFIIGVLIARPRKKAITTDSQEGNEIPPEKPSSLSDEDREYIS